MWIMNNRLFFAAVATLFVVLPHGARAACDVCEATGQAFNPDAALQGTDGETGTCQDFATESGLENLEPDSLECILGTAVAVIFCCGDGIPCLSEVAAFGLCTESDSTCAACTEAPGTTLPPGGDGDAAAVGFPDWCAEFANEDFQDGFDELGNCCSACSSEVEALQTCLEKECGGGGDSASTMIYPKTLVVSSTMLVGALAMGWRFA